MLPQVVQKMQKGAGVGASLEAMLAWRGNCPATGLQALVLKMKILNPWSQN